MFKRIALFTVIACCLFFQPLPVRALELTKPAGKAILTIKGNVAVTNEAQAAIFDRAMLESMGVRRLKTSTNWTEGTSEFEGVLARDLFAKLGAKGTTVSAIALNDYKIDIPFSDFMKYDVLLALKMDGKELLARDKGPIWIVYPRDQNPELRNAQSDSRWIWQLKELTIR